MMNYKIKQLIGLFLPLFLFGCGQIGSSKPTPTPTPTSPSNNTIAITAQSFNNATINSESIAYNSRLATTFFSNIAGNYLTLSGESNSYLKANRENTITLYNFDPDAKNNLAPSVSAFNISYYTPSQQISGESAATNAIASGLIIVPNGINIKGVVIYFHPTTFGKNQVPSCLGDPTNANNFVSSNLPSYCTLTNLDGTGANMFMMLSHVFASHGYAVIAPDYLGQGSDYNSVHPYVAFPDINVLSALNMFPALRSILATSYRLSPTTSLPLFITGYSEGGGYALDAARMLENSQYSLYTSRANLQLKMTSPQEGAYSLVDQLNFELTDLNDGLTNCSESPTYQCGLVNMMNGESSLSPIVQSLNSYNIGSAIYAGNLKPLLLSYILTAINYYDYQNSTASYDATMNHQFWSTIPTSLGNSTLYQLYSGEFGSKLTGEQIEEVILDNTLTINNYDPSITPTVNLFFDGFPLSKALPQENWGQNNNANNFVHESILTDPTFTALMNNASTYNWHSNHHIHFINMAYDSAVTTLNYLQAYSCMKNGVNNSNSHGECSTNSANSEMVASSIIPNFPLTNNSTQLSPLTPFATTVNANALAHFWTDNIISDQSFGLYTPYDHGDMMVIGSIVALCTFENEYANGTNSSYCP